MWTRSVAPSVKTRCASSPSLTIRRWWKGFSATWALGTTRRPDRPRRAPQFLPVDALRQAWQDGAAMNESEKQFSFTRAASSTSGRAKNQFAISFSNAKATFAVGGSDIVIEAPKMKRKMSAAGRAATRAAAWEFKERGSVLVKQHLIHAVECGIVCVHRYRHKVGAWNGTNTFTCRVPPAAIFLNNEPRVFENLFQ